jgi:small subunit ribosomal protein S9
VESGDAIAALHSDYGGVMAEVTYYAGTGRRKTAIAQVRLMPGTGVMTVNGKPLEEYFPGAILKSRVLAPLTAVDAVARWDGVVKVVGGGVHGQAGAVSHGLARALVASDETLRQVLRKGGLLTRDPREKERKKPGLRRARKAKQYTKR